MTGNCVSCHMQEGGTSDVPHVIFTDHWIRKQPGSPRDPSAGRPVFDTTGALQLASLRRMEALDGTRSPNRAADVKATIAYFRFYETMHRHPEYIHRAINRGRSGQFLEANAQGRISLARALSEADSVDAAARVMRKASRERPGNAWVDYWRGVMEEARGRNEVAIRAYRSAVNRQPKLMEAQVKLAGALFRASRLAAKADQTSEAIQHFRHAIASDSSHAEAYGSLGTMYVRTNQLNRAKRMFERVLELDPQNKAARRLLKKLSP